MHHRSHLYILGFAALALVFAVAALRFSGPHEVGTVSSGSNSKQSRGLEAIPSMISDAISYVFYSTTTISTNSRSVSSPTPKPSSALPDGPVLSARAYLVGDITTGKIYFSNNSKTALPVASMSKLLTAAATLFSLSPTNLIEITPGQAAFPPDQSNLKAGEKYTSRELLYPLLLSSSNVAAEALADSGNRQAFLELMSSYAWEINMPSTYFADPSGIDPKNSASAVDMFALAKYLFYYQQDILALTRTPMVVFATTTLHGYHVVQSIHPFVRDPRFLGGKTGRTPEAGETMLTIMNIGEKPIAFVILGANVGRREADTQILINKYIKEYKK